MDITILPLTPKLADDYFDFFENRAFTDDSPYRCYCQVFQMSKAEYDEAYNSISDPNEIGRASRKIAKQQIDAGILRGYLAFADGMAIGWCNVNDKANFPANSFNGAFGHFHTPEKNREKAVVCFEIAPEYRMKGVATALLRRAVEDARQEGYIAVEGFPVLRQERFEWDSPGPLRLYEKEGFVKTAEKDSFCIMRKEL